MAVQRLLPLAAWDQAHADRHQAVLGPTTTGQAGRQAPAHQNLPFLAAPLWRVSQITTMGASLRLDWLTFVVQPELIQLRSAISGSMATKASSSASGTVALKPMCLNASAPAIAPEKHAAASVA